MIPCIRIIKDNVGIDLSKYDGMIIQTHFDNPDLEENVVDDSGVRFFVVDQPREMDYGILQLGDPFVTMAGQEVNIYGNISPFFFDLTSMLIIIG